MHYAREHVKRYWGFAYRRALGISLMTFAIAMAIGVAFSSILGATNNTDIASAIMFWGFLIIATAAVLVFNFIRAHTSCVRFLNEEEHRQHSKYMGVWIVSLVLGALAFATPLIYFNSTVEPLILLFSFGGVFWVLYLSILVLFRHSYYEIAIGAIALWAVFLLSMMEVSSAGTANPAYMLFVSMVTLIIVSGFIGIAMVSVSSSEFEKEFVVAATRAPRRSRSRRGR